MDDQTADHGSGRLTLFILAAIILALVVAFFAPEFASKFELGGEIFLRLLKMMVVPLVVTSVMAGILGMGDIRKLGKPGAVAIGYYIATTILAVVVGLVVVNVIQPGADGVEQSMLAEATSKKSDDEIKQELRDHLAEGTGLSASEVSKVLKPLSEPAERSLSTILHNLALMLFTDNLVGAAVEQDLLPLIVFSIIFAGMLTTMGKRVESLTDLIVQTNDALLSFIMVLMNVAPLGIFCLVAHRFGVANAKGELMTTIGQLGWYMLTVLIGLFIHALVTLPFLFWVCTRKNPYRYMMHMSQALLTAFSTASSSATLPVTMECAIKNAKVSKKSTEFVLPLGATINMDGTALYEAAAAIFIAQVAAVQGAIDPLTMTDQVIVAITATLAAIGAAGIPEAGLVTMLIVLNAVGLPLEYIGLILSIDWLLDRFRTAINVLGDSMGAAIVERSMSEETS